MGVSRHPPQTPSPSSGFLRRLHSCRCPLPSLKRPTHPEVWHQSLPLQPHGRACQPEAAWRRHRWADSGDRHCSSREGHDFWLCGTEREEAGVLPTQGSGDPSHKSPILLSKQHKKAPRRPEGGGRQMGVVRAQRRDSGEIAPRDSSPFMPELQAWPQSLGPGAVLTAKGGARGRTCRGTEGYSVSHKAWPPPHGTGSVQGRGSQRCVLQLTKGREP